MARQAPGMSVGAAAMGSFGVTAGGAAIAGACATGEASRPYHGAHKILRGPNLNSGGNGIRVSPG